MIDLSKEPPHLIGHLVQFLYRGRYDDHRNFGASDDERSDFTKIARLHIDMYSLAYRFFIKELAIFAALAWLNLFCDPDGGDWSETATQAFFASVVSIYRTTPERIRGLRNAAVELAVRQWRTLIKDNMLKAKLRKLLVDESSFAADLACHMCEA